MSLLRLRTWVLFAAPLVSSGPAEEVAKVDTLMGSGYKERISPSADNYYDFALNTSLSGNTLGEDR